jgi:hypothetical protein
VNSIEKHDGGAFICCIMMFVISTYYAKKNTTQGYLLMSDIISYVSNKTNTTKMTKFRRELLLLVKVISRIRAKQLKSTSKTTAFENYLKLSNVVDYGTKQSLCLNVISCIQKFDEIASYYKDDNITLKLNEIKLVQESLLNEVSGNELRQLAKRQSNNIHMKDDFQMHDYIIERYKMIPQKKLFIQEFSTTYKTRVLNDYWETLSLEEKKKHDKENWKLYMHDTTQQSIEVARKHILECYVAKIKDLQERIIDEYNIVHRTAHKQGHRIQSTMKYDQLCMELRLLLDHIINKSITHVADCIVGVTKIKENQYACLIDAKKINLMGIEKGYMVQKKTDLKFMKENFTVDFIKEVDAAFSEDGICSNWICQEQPQVDEITSIGTERRSEAIENVDDIIHKYANGIIAPVNRCNNDLPKQRIFWIKGSFIIDNEMEMNATCKDEVMKAIEEDNSLVYNINFDWEISFNDAKSPEHKYEKISEAELGDCVTAHAIYEWKIQCMASFQIMQVACSFVSVEKTFPEDDEKDLEYKKVVSNRGSIGGATPEVNKLDNPTLLVVTSFPVAVCDLLLLFPRYVFAYGLCKTLLTLS